MVARLGQRVFVHGKNASATRFILLLSDENESQNLGDDHVFDRRVDGAELATGDSPPQRMSSGAY